MKLIALDLGTHTGWSTLQVDDGGPRLWFVGEWDLTPGRHSDGGMRFARFQAELRRLVDSLGHCDFLFYEEVAAHKGTAAAHVYGGLVAVAQLVCKERDIPYEGVPVGTIKKHATGKGNANKSAMVDAALNLYAPHVSGVEPGGYLPITDNMADALALADYALHEVLYTKAIR